MNSHQSMVWINKLFEMYLVVGECFVKSPKLFWQMLKESNNQFVICDDGHPDIETFPQLMIIEVHSIPKYISSKSHSFLPHNYTPHLMVFEFQNITQYSLYSMQPKFSSSTNSPQQATIYNLTRHTFSNTLSDIPQQQQVHHPPLQPHTQPLYPIINFTETNSKNGSPEKPMIQPFRISTPLSKDSMHIFNSSARRKINIDGSHIEQLQVYYNQLEQMVDVLKDARRFLKENDQ